MRKIAAVLLTAIAVLMTTGCPDPADITGGGNEITLSSEKEITAFSLAGLTPAVTATIDGSEICLTVPHGTALTALVATFNTTGVKVEAGGAVQTSGTTAVDFTSPVTYKVTAEDGSVKKYTVTVTEARSPAKEITAFSFNELSPAVTAAIKDTSISLFLPYGINSTALTATFTTTGVKVEAGGAVQISGTTAVDFSNPVTYTVTADDGSEKMYTVTVTVSPGPAVFASGLHNMIIKRDNSLWTFGGNHSGELGDGTSLHRSTPEKILDIVKHAAAGEYHSLMLKADDTLWACGRNSRGQLGDGTSKERLAPVEITDDVKDIAAGASHTLILKTDKTLWACGDNKYGQLGDGTTTNRFIPVKITENVMAVAAGANYTLFIKTDNTLWACGTNHFGELGDGTTINRSIPVKIAENVMAVAAGSIHSLILKTDNTLSGYAARITLASWETAPQISGQPLLKLRTL